MEKINVAELLKDCPEGMELDCTIWDNVTFIGIEDIGYINIMINTPCGTVKLSNQGCFSHNCNSAKCVIFPKGKTTWEGFQRPFKDGDILSHQCPGLRNRTIYIYRHHPTMNTSYYVALDGDDLELMVNHMEGHALSGYNTTARLATEEEKQKLFQAIKDNGYKWNAETKTLERLIKPNFKVGNWVVDNCSYVWKIKGILNQFYLLEGIEGGESRPTIDWVDKTFHLWTINDAKDGDVLAAHECLVLFKKLDGLNIKCYCTYHFMDNQRFYVDTLQNKDAFHPTTEEEKQKLFNALKENDYNWNAETKTLEKFIKPKFKVGDKIRHKITNKDDVYEISKVYDDSYGLVGFTWMLYMKYQNEYELVPDKFDITTLVPFESRVLMRSSNAKEWTGTIFSHYSNNKFYAGGMCCNQCIPYENNEHLLGKTDDCDEFYKTWEKTGD